MSAPNLDDLLDRAIKRSPNLMVPWFLISSYGYYQMDVSLLSDERFDKLAADLLARWGRIEHVHKGFINEEDLRAGTGYAIRQWPGLVRGAFEQLKDELERRTRVR